MNKLTKTWLNANRELVLSNIRGAYCAAIFHIIKGKDIGEAINWYAHSFAAATKLAKQYNVPINVVCGVIAALSPRISWPRNMELAEMLLNAPKGKLPCLGRSEAKAKAILNSDGSQAAILALLGNGPKTRAFYFNLSEPQKNDHVTIDVHATSIAVGENQNHDKVSITPAAYKVLQSCYIQVAAESGRFGHELQAITWVAWRLDREIVLENQKINRKV